jgi:DNA-binding response OmpR family regulator
MGTILLADDDAAVRDFVRRALSSDGHTVYTADDGTEALKILDVHGAAIGIIVTDLDMPGLDGISLAREARARHPGVAIVFMTAFSDQLDRIKTLGTSRITGLAKPFPLDKIKQVVRTIAD